MAKTAVNLTKMVAQCIHTPRNKETGEPAYIRSEIIEDSMDTSKIVCNSPNNIRRVFITHNKVYVNMFHVPSGAGGFKKTISRTLPVDLKNVADAKVNGIMFDTYSITQTGLGAFVYKWIASNIEEIYFDYGILLSPEVSNIAGMDLFNKYAMQGTQGVDGKWVAELFRRTCGKNVANMETRFPRLRCIAYVSNLEEVLASLGGNIGLEKLDDSIEGLKKTWFEVSKDTINSLSVKNPNQTVAYWMNTKLYGKPMVKYFGQDGVYLYDKIVLNKYFSNIVEKIQDAAREMQGTKVGTNNDTDNSVTKEEELFNAVYEENGNVGVMGLFKVMTEGVPKAEWMEMINRMTDDKKELYKGILGIK